MTGQRWWHVFFGATIAVVAALGGITWTPSPAHRIVLWVTLSLLVIAYLTMGRFALRDGRFAAPFSVILIVASGVIVACSPNAAIIQSIAFPLLWCVFDSRRPSIIATVLLTLSVSAGFLSAIGTGADAIAQTVMIESISLVGSLALGLWISQIAELSHERKRLLDELTETQGQLAALNRESGITSERERLAREIHDTIAQDLTALVMLAQRTQRELAAGKTSIAVEQLTILEDGARNALAETRALVASAAPVGLTSGNIGDALHRLATRFSRETGVTVLVDLNDVTAIHRDAEVVLLRIAQEGLANVRKHADATAAVIELTAEKEAVRLTVRDDGRGFDTRASTDGFGLSGMRDRLALVDGSLDISSSATEGTSLVARLPVAAPA